jgi:hypothetical protein
MLTNQELEVNKKTGEVHLSNTYTNDPVLKENKEMRNEVGKGVTKDGTMRMVAQIPEFEFRMNPMLREYLNLLHAGNKEEAKRTLRVFLALHPEYRSSEGKF